MWLRRLRRRFPEENKRRRRRRSYVARYGDCLMPSSEVFGAGDSIELSRLIPRYQSGGLSPKAVITEVLRRVEAYGDPSVWITRVPADQVFAQLDSAEAKIAAGIPQPLLGIPFAVKDNIDVAGQPTTAACPAFRYIADRSAHVVQQLCDAGAIVIGKTNLDQFATGLVGMRSPYGACRNVFDPRYISGGSSSGSAVAVAAGLVSFALGTDTAGSGRVPAAFNNLVGLKPSCGRLSTSGVVPACKSLDCVSIFTHSCDEARLLLRIAEGYDPSDPYSRDFTDVPPSPVSEVLRRAGSDAEKSGSSEYLRDRLARPQFPLRCSRRRRSRILWRRRSGQVVRSIDHRDGKTGRAGGRD